MLLGKDADSGKAKMKVKLNLGNQSVDADRMGFKPIEENWSVYKLEDGTIVKLKLVVSDVFKLPGADPVTGEPQLIVRSSNVMSVEPSVPKSEVH
ncbi:MAG: hypothetical protein ACRERD_07780 [Candidatus Binatia bacterium]